LVDGKKLLQDESHMSLTDLMDDPREHKT